MSKIKELLKDKDSILVFDVDGCLAVLEFGDYNHYSLSDESWIDAINSGKEFYSSDRVSPKLQNFINSRNINNVYVITKSYTINEDNMKYEFLTKNYNILRENIYCVREDDLKKEALKEIKKKYPDLEDKKIVMIDDSVSILTDIMNNTNFSTVHISSFFDI